MTKLAEQLALLHKKLSLDQLQQQQQQHAGGGAGSGRAALMGPGGAAASPLQQATEDAAR